jgi:hypothetical protein
VSASPTESDVDDMAIQTEHNPGGNKKGATAESSPETQPKRDRSAAPVSHRGGGPSTLKGKRRSSQNATKHGVFSKSPVIDNECEEDWIEHWEGYRKSFQPQGSVEELHVSQMALNRWQRLREERWMAEKLQLQFKGIEHCNRQSIDPKMDLPEDEAAWAASSPTAAMIVLELLEESDPHAIVPPKAVVSFLLAYERVTGSFDLFAELGSLRAQDHDQGPFDPYAISVGQIHGWIQLAARGLGVSDRFVIDGIETEIRTAFHHELLRQNDLARRDEILSADALVLNGVDFAGHERRVNLLDKEYERNLKWLEVSQRARGGALPPPIRLHHSEG